MHLEGNVVVQVREGDAVLSAHRLPDDDLVDVVELIPVLIPESQMHSILSKEPLARHTPPQNAVRKNKNNLQHKGNILFPYNFACSFLSPRQKKSKGGHLLWIRELGVSLVDLGRDSVPSGGFTSTKPLTILQIKVAMLKRLHPEAQVSDLTDFTFLPTLSYHLSWLQLIIPHSISSPAPSLPSSFESNLILFLSSITIWASCILLTASPCPWPEVQTWVLQEWPDWGPWQWRRTWGRTGRSSWGRPGLSGADWLVDTTPTSPAESDASVGMLTRSPS